MKRNIRKTEGEISNQLKKDSDKKGLHSSVVKPVGARFTLPGFGPDSAT